MTYLNQRLLSLDRHLDLGLGHHNVHVATLDIGRNGDGHVDVADGLSPFVGKLGLFGVFLGLALFFLAFTLGDIAGRRILFRVGGGHCLNC